MHQMAIKPQTKLETLRSTYTLVFQKRLTTTKIHATSIHNQIVMSIIQLYYYTYDMANV